MGFGDHHATHNQFCFPKVLEVEPQQYLTMEKPCSNGRCLAFFLGQTTPIFRKLRVSSSNETNSTTASLAPSQLYRIFWLKKTTNISWNKIPSKWIITNLLKKSSSNPSEEWGNWWKLLFCQSFKRIGQSIHESNSPPKNSDTNKFSIKSRVIPGTPNNGKLTIRGSHNWGSLKIPLIKWNRQILFLSKHIIFQMWGTCRIFQPPKKIMGKTIWEQKLGKNRLVDVNDVFFQQIFLEVFVFSIFFERLYGPILFCYFWKHPQGFATNLSSVLWFKHIKVSNSMSRGSRFSAEACVMDAMFCQDIHPSTVLEEDHQQGLLSRSPQTNNFVVPS